MLRNQSVIAVVILAAATALGQSSAGPLASRRQTVAATSNAEGIATANRAKLAANQHLQDMAATLTKMHALLKQMSAKNSNSKDASVKANLEMWSLMVAQLDKEYEQLVAAARQREDLEARRAALYKQADDRAAEAARKAQEASRAGAANPNANSQPAASPAAPQGPATPQSQATPQSPSTSPN